MNMLTVSDTYVKQFTPTVGVEFYLKRSILPGPRHVTLKVWDSMSALNACLHRWNLVRKNFRKNVFTKTWLLLHSSHGYLLLLHSVRVLRTFGRWNIALGKFKVISWKAFQTLSVSAVGHWRFCLAGKVIHNSNFFWAITIFIEELCSKLL